MNSLTFEFNSLNDVKEFAKYLSKELENFGYKDKSKMVYEFSYNSYTTSSEYLGEFRILLEDLKKQNVLDDDNIKIEVDAAIRAINKAFGN